MATVAIALSLDAFIPSITWLWDPLPTIALSLSLSLSLSVVSQYNRWSLTAVGVISQEISYDKANDAT